MAKNCLHCGHHNDDSALRCVCGSDLPADTTSAPAGTSTQAGTHPPAPTDGRNLGLRRTVLVLWTIGFIPLFAALHSLLHLSPLYRSLIGTGVFCVPVVAALWFLGREKHRMLRTWRIFFVLRAILVTPLLLTIAEGLAEQGWPSGRFNRPIAHILLLLLTLSFPAFLTGLCALIRTYRLAGALALVAGILSIVDGVLLIRATSRFWRLSIRLGDVLNNVMFGAKVETCLAIPIGIALIVGGLMTLRAARARRATP